MGMESRNRQKGHLQYLLNVHSKFQPPNSIGEGDIRGTYFFQAQKAENPHPPPPLIDTGYDNF